MFHNRLLEFGKTAQKIHKKFILPSLNDFFPIPTANISPKGGIDIHT